MCIRDSHQNDFCIKMGSDESHFNFPSIIVRGKVSHKTASTDHNVCRKVIAV